MKSDFFTEQVLIVTQFLCELNSSWEGKSILCESSTFIKLFPPKYYLIYNHFIVISAGQHKEIISEWRFLAMTSELPFDRCFQNLPSAPCPKIMSLCEAWNWALMNGELLVCLKF